jgi:3-oxoacyl-[acyl-carrier-protein] synthase-1
VTEAVAILASGMVTGVGLNAASSCAAIRCAITNFAETRFMDKGGEWIIGSEVPLPQPWRGRAKLLRLVVPAIIECLSSVPSLNPESIPLLLCVAESERLGRLAGLDQSFFDEVETDLGMRFHRESAIIPQGKVAGVTAIQLARQLITDKTVSYCLVAGVDSFLVAGTLAGYEKQSRLHTSKNSDGFIPGEAGAAILIGHMNETTDGGIVCLGIGTGQETATVNSGEPLKGDGLVTAIRAALTGANRTMADVDYRMTDLSGEQYGFKEASLAVSRTLRQRKERFELWHPADCIGDVGAAIVPCMLSVCMVAAKKKYAPGKAVLCHAANDSGQRAAMILTAEV